MKILFLDIDGVLNSVRSAVAYNGYPLVLNKEEIRGEEKFDEVALNLIRKLCDETGCVIVLSSTWRYYYEPSILGRLLNLPIVDKTPRKLTSSRGEEIRMWFDDWNSKINPKIEKYAIVDDDSDMLESQKEFFVKTSCIDGLSYENYKKLLELLK